MVYYGPLIGDRYDDDADLRVDGLDDGDHLGRSLAAADLDGDGLDDLLVGAPEVDGYEALSPIPDGGAAWVLSGSPTGLSDLSGASAGLYGTEWFERVGYGVLAPGDVDGDGHPDVALVGRSEAEGLVTYIVHGPFSGRLILDLAAARIEGAGIGAASGDLTGDGLPDLALSDGSYPRRAEDRVYVVPGNVEGIQDVVSAAVAGVAGEDEFEAVGYALAVGDTDGDGADDLVVDLLGLSGAPTGRRSAIAVFSGPLAGDRAEPHVVYGRYEYFPYDSSISVWGITLGDATGDGRTDVVVAQDWSQSILAVAGGGPACLFERVAPGPAPTFTGAPPSAFAVGTCAQYRLVFELVRYWSSEDWAGWSTPWTEGPSVEPDADLWAQVVDAAWPDLVEDLHYRVEGRTAEGAISSSPPVAFAE